MEYHINRMVKAIEGIKDKQEIVDTLKEYWRDKVAFIWQVDDVIDRAKERDIVLTEDQALDVLCAMENGHDCTIGMNWDVMDYHIDGVFESE